MTALNDYLEEEEIDESETELETTSVKENGNVEFENEADNESVINLKIEIIYSFIDFFVYKGFRTK
jgi:hypothetical protein